MSTNKEKFLDRFHKIKGNKVLLKELQQYHKNKTKLYQEGLNEELKEDLYRTYFFIYEIEKYLPEIKVFIRNRFKKSKEPLSETPFMKKFLGIETDQEPGSAYLHLKTFYHDHYESYLEGLRKVLKAPKFQAYIFVHEVDVFAHLVKKMLEKRKKPAKLKVNVKVNVNLAKSLQAKSLQSNNMDLLNILDNTELKSLREKAKHVSGPKKKEIEKEIRVLLGQKIEKIGKDGGPTSSRADKHDEAARSRAVLAMGSKVKRQMDKATSLSKKIGNKGVQQVAQDEAMRQLKKEVFKQLPSDSRVKAGSTYYENQIKKRIREKKEEKKQAALDGGGRKKTKKKGNGRRAYKKSKMV